MYSVQITPKRSRVRREVARFNDEDQARAYAERKLAGYKGAVAEVFDESEGGFIRSTLYLGRARI